MSCRICATILRNHPNIRELPCGDRKSRDKHVGLGPANDDFPNASAEIRAAEIAASHLDPTVLATSTDFTELEHVGYVGFLCADNATWRMLRASSQWQAGRIASLIEERDA